MMDQVLTGCPLRLISDESFPSTDRIESMRRPTWARPVRRNLKEAKNAQFINHRDLQQQVPTYLRTSGPVRQAKRFPRPDYGVDTL